MDEHLGLSDRDRRLHAVAAVTTGLAVGLVCVGTLLLDGERQGVAVAWVGAALLVLPMQFSLRAAVQPRHHEAKVFGGVVAGLVATTGTALLLLEVWDVTSWWGYVLIALAGAAPLAGYAGVLWSRGETVPDRSTVG